MVPLLQESLFFKHNPNTVNARRLTKRMDRFVFDNLNTNYSLYIKNVKREEHNHHPKLPPKPPPKPPLPNPPRPPKPPKPPLLGKSPLRPCPKGEESGCPNSSNPKNYWGCWTGSCKGLSKGSIGSYLEPGGILIELGFYKFGLFWGFLKRELSGPTYY